MMAAKVLSDWYLCTYFCTFMTPSLNATLCHLSVRRPSPNEHKISSNLTWELGPIFLQFLPIFYCTVNQNMITSIKKFKVNDSWINLHIRRKKLIISLALPRALLQEWPHHTFFFTFYRFCIFFWQISSAIKLFTQIILRLCRNYMLESVSPKWPQWISIW